jgi:hypothetical protein
MIRPLTPRGSVRAGCGTCSSLCFVSSSTAWRGRSLGPTRAGLLIELTLRGTLAGHAVEWTSVDRITLSGGQIATRHSCFDPLPLISALVCGALALAEPLFILLARSRAVSVPLTVADV